MTFGWMEGDGGQTAITHPAAGCVSGWSSYVRVQPP